MSALPLAPPIGSTKDDLDTPALCLDLDVMEANIHAMAAACQSRGVAWRPHAKGHKVAAIARSEIAAGAIGVTCAKLGEAEVMAAGGVEDILIANLIVGSAKVRRLVELRRQADPIVCIDHLDQALPLSRAFAEAGLTLRVIVEVDIGLARVGVQPGEPTLRLAGELATLPGLRLVGIMGYEGHLLALPDSEDKARKIHAALDTLVESKQQLLAAGLCCEIVSCAGTGSYRMAIEHPGITEIQAGGAIFMDLFYRQQCQVPDLGYALTILATVVSRPTPERAIIDAGRKTMNIEVNPPQVLGRTGIVVERLSAEHGHVRLEPSAQGLKIGERLEFIPGYADLTTMLHDNFYAFRQGRLVEIIPIEGRGRLT